jgi:hypothetical protein
MKYILLWNLPHGTYHPTVKRFLETGGAPPKGVTQLGRWHGMSGQGVAILESDDPKALFEMRAQWSDLLDLTLTPCLEDADAGAVLAAMAKR